MLRVFSLIVGVSVLVAAGCTQETEKAKTPGSETAPAEENTFKLELPTGATNIAKGGSEQITIGVDRGENMTEAIALTFEPAEGITIKPQSPTIKAGESEVEITVQATAQATAGEKAIPVTGKAGEKETTGTFKIEVTEDAEANPTNPKPTNPNPTEPNPDGTEN